MALKHALLVLSVVLVGPIRAAETDSWQELLRQADSLSVELQQDTAIVLGTLALSKAEAELGTEDTAVARVLHRIGNYHFYKQEYSEAKSFHKRALAIRQKILGLRHGAVGYSLTSLAVIYRRLGKYAEAEPLHERALEIWEDAYGPNHEYVAWVLNNLTTLCEYQGKFAEAEAHCRRAMAIYENLHGKEHHLATGCLSHLATLHKEQGKYAKAESLFVQALAIREKVRDPDSSWVAQTLNDLVTLYQLQGRISEAEAYARRALALAEKSQGPDHPLVAGYLHNLADLYCDQGKYAEAEPSLERALTLKRSVLGSENYDVASIEETFSKLFRLRGDTAKAMETAARACKTMHKSFVDNAMVLSEKDALSFSQRLHNSVDNFISCYVELGSGDLSVMKTAANLILATKGRVSDGLFDRQRTLVQETDSTTMAVAEALRVAKLRLSRRYVKGPGEDSDRFRSGLDSLTTLVNELETDLSRLSASFRKKRQIRELNVDSIRASLPENSCLIEYLKYDYLSLQPNSATPHYLAVVVSESAEPVILNIGSAAPIDELIDLYRQHMLRVPLAGLPSDEDVEEYRGLAKELYRRIWKPVENHTSAKKLVLIAPDGGLNLVSFAGLLDDAGTYLIERYPILYLSAGRDLVRLKEVATPAVGLLALGDPDYDASVTDRLMINAPLRDKVAKPEYSVSRSTRIGRGGFRGIKLSPLPWTRREVKRVAQAWTTTRKEPVELFCGLDASEERLKAEAPGKRVIHLATHGYFLQDNASSEEPGGKAEQDYCPAVRNPLLKSGLFLAGANQRGQIADSAGVDDGILTAFEVSAMNLQGTEWVVLSACESGLGEVKAGEGVWGLRRAFQMAGARTVISSLWSIPDKQTVSIMEQLYSSDDDDLARVMRQMAVNEIEKIRNRGLPDHPYTWSAFIAVGDWRIYQ